MTTRKLISTILLLIVLAMPILSQAAEWQMKQGPMMTPWAENIDPNNVFPEYPRPQMERDNWMNLNGIWDLRKGTVDEAYSASFDYDKKILVPFPIESALSGVMEKSDEQCYWYKRTFTLPDNMKGKDVIINFGAVDWQCKVFVNGTQVGEHTGGYDPFSFNITSALKGSGEQELAVYIYDNTGVQGQPTGKQSKNPSICWYTAVSGIWQTVWLEAVNKAHITYFEVEPTVDRNWINYKVEASVSNATVNITVKDKDGNVVGSAANASTGAVTRITIENPHLWSPDDPYLYDVDMQLVSNGTVTDNVKSYCALRKINVSKINGITRILLNNKEIFQLGPLDQGFWPDGIYTAPCDEALLFDVQTMKEIGFNMVRKHIKTEPARWYYHCDREGLLVWQDLPSPNLPKGSEDFAKENFRKETTNIIRSLKNFPSIVHWVVFNEGWGQFDTVDVTNLVDRLVNSLSPSRYGKASLICCASGWTDAEVGNIIDNHSYPYPSFSHSNTRAAVCGEYGGITLKVPGHIWPGGDFQYTVVDTKTDFTAYFNMLCDKIQNGYYSGLNAAVYTQLSDVEIEKNGFWTYDRKVFKSHDINEVRQKVLETINMPNNGIKPKTILSTANEHTYTWRYTTNSSVHRHWYETTFNDSEWAKGPAAFGNGGPEEFKHLLKTPWTNDVIHMRRWFYLGEITQENINKLRFQSFHDDDITVYLNGVLAATVSGCNFSYGPIDISKAALSTLKPNSWNLIAVEGRQGGGQQIMDIGISAYTDTDFEYTESFEDLENPPYAEQPTVGSAKAPKFAKIDKPVPAEGAQSGGVSATEAGQFYHTADFSNVAWGDIDNDGNLELVYSGHNAHLSNKSAAVLYKYNGENYVRLQSPFDKAYYACPTWIDYNNDEKLDLFIPGFNNYNYDDLEDVAAFIYKNNGTNSNGVTLFEEVNQARTDSNQMGITPIHNPLGGGRSRHWVATGDYDNDGFTDIVVAGQEDYVDPNSVDENGKPYIQTDNRVLQLYRNNGGQGFELQETPLNGNAPFAGLSRGSVWFADMDADGWLDILASGYGPREGNMMIYYNNGNGTFSESAQEFIGVYDGSSFPVDLNADGKLDIVCAGYANPSGNGSGKNVYVYQNVGDRIFTFLPKEYCGFEGVDGATHDVADVNNDGLPDIFIGGHGSEHEITTWLYINNGDFSFTACGAYYQDVFGKLWSFDRISHGNNHLLDFNHDGYLDAWSMGWAQSSVCSNSCAAHIYENVSADKDIVANTAPQQPNGLSCSYDKNTGIATFTWNTSTDDITPSDAIAYNFFIKKAGSDQCSMVIPANISTGFIKVNQYTNQLMRNSYSVKVENADEDYEWGVQAIDNGRMSSTFATSTFNPSTASGISSTKAGEIKIYTTKGMLHYSTPKNTTIEIYNTIGGLVRKTKVSGTGVIEDLEGGIYMVYAKAKKAQKSLKVQL